MSFYSVHMMVSQDYVLTYAQEVVLYCVILCRIDCTSKVDVAHEFGAYERVRDADHEKLYRIRHRTRPFSMIDYEYVCEVSNLICN